MFMSIFILNIIYCLPLILIQKQLNKFIIYKILLKRKKSRVKPAFLSGYIILRY